MLSILIGIVLASFLKASTHRLNWFEAVLCTVIHSHWLDIIYRYYPALDTQLHALKYHVTMMSLHSMFKDFLLDDQ